MADLTCPEKGLDELVERYPRFHRNAYVFVLDALHTVVARMREKRHLSGEELARGVRDLALHRFGPISRTVLGHWGIHSTEDVGEVVFAMVEIGLLVKQDQDSLDDFRNLFDFGQVFEAEYPWSAAC